MIGLPIKAIFLYFAGVFIITIWNRLVLLQLTNAPVTTSHSTPDTHLQGGWDPPDTSGPPRYSITPGINSLIPVDGVSNNAICCLFYVLEQNYL